MIQMKKKEILYNNNIHYENQMTENNKLDERMLKCIIKDKCKYVNSNENLK